MKNLVLLVLTIFTIMSCKKESNNQPGTNQVQSVAKKITLSDTAGRTIYEFNYDAKVRLTTVQYFQYTDGDTGIGKQFFRYESDQIVVDDTFKSKLSQSISSSTYFTDKNGKMAPFFFNPTYHANGFVKSITYNFWGNGRVEFINDGQNIIKITDLKTDSLGNVIDTLSITSLTYSDFIVKQHFLHNMYTEYGFDFECGNLGFMIFPGYIGKLNTNYIESVQVDRQNGNPELFTFIYEADSLGQISKITYSEPHETTKVFNVNFK